MYGLSHCVKIHHECPWWTVLLIPQDSWLWGLWQGLGMGSAGFAGGRLCRQHPRPLTSTKCAGAACCAPWTCVEQKQGLQWRMIEVYSSVMSSLLWTLEGNIRDIGALLTFLQELCGWQDSVFHFTINKLGLGCYKFGRDEWLRQEEQPYSTNCLCTLPKHSAPLPVPEMYSLSCRCVGESVVWGLFRAIHPGMPNIFKKKRLVFGWVFFPLPLLGELLLQFWWAPERHLGQGARILAAVSGWIQMSRNSQPPPVLLVPSFVRWGWDSTAVPEAPQCSGVAVLWCRTWSIGALATTRLSLLTHW